MFEEELKRIWYGSPQKENIKFERSRLLIELDHKLEDLERSIKYRDLREISVALILIPVFAFIAYYAPSILSKIGASAISLYCLVVIYKLKKVRRSKKPVDVTLSVSEQLNDSKKYIIEQMELINSVLYWYILPFLLGSVVYFLGLKLKISFLVSLLIFVLVVNTGILILNKYVVNKTFNPILKNIDSVIIELNDINPE